MYKQRRDGDRGCTNNAENVCTNEVEKTNWNANQTFRPNQTGLLISQTHVYTQPWPLTTDQSQTDKTNESTDRSTYINSWQAHISRVTFFSNRQAISHKGARVSLTYKQTGHNCKKPKAMSGRSQQLLAVHPASTKIKVWQCIGICQHEHQITTTLCNLQGSRQVKVMR